MTDREIKIQCLSECLSECLSLAVKEFVDDAYKELKKSIIGVTDQWDEDQKADRSYEPKPKCKINFTKVSDFSEYIPDNNDEVKIKVERLEQIIKDAMLSGFEEAREFFGKQDTPTFNLSSEEEMQELKKNHMLNIFGVIKNDGLE